MPQRLFEFLILVMLATLLLLFSAGTAYSAVPSFQLRDTAGSLHTSAEWIGARAIVLFFVTNDCAVANSYVPEMNRIQAAYAPRGVRTYAVVADPGLAPSIVAAYARDYGYAFPLLLDPLQDLVQLTGATVTPQVAVLTPGGKLLYRGRIDNRVADFGKQRPQATVHDLRDALDEVLAGKPVATPFTQSVGCAITGVR
jgi:peroxiredoxin